MVRVIESASAERRLTAARAFLDSVRAHTEVLIVGASRGAADDFVRDYAQQRPATFGLHRFSLTQLAARLAAPALSQSRRAPATALGVEAVAARTLFEADRAGTLSYFAPVAHTPGFPRALARTLQELALAAASAPALRGLPQVGSDLANLLERFDEQFDTAASVERAAFFRMATAAARAADSLYAHCLVVLLDPAINSAAERELIDALLERSPDALVTIPVGDAASRTAIARHAAVVSLDDISGKGGPDRPEAAGLARMRRYLFSAEAPAPAAPLDEVELFSAPGEGREAVEIARRILREAARGVAFDRMAVVVRAPQQYASLLEHALRRAGVPAAFERGTRRPHPAGRAFLALLACADDNLSARRFAEYLSLGQVPDAAPAAEPPAPASTDEVFGPVADQATSRSDEPDEPAPGPRAFRAPWKWERLLADSRVVASAERWTRRLNGLIEECELQRRELRRTDPDSGRIEQLARKIDDLTSLAAFALPIVRTLAAWPSQATWAEWLTAFEALAPRALRRPEQVLRVLADLRPMGAVGPVSLREAAQVLADRLAMIEAEPPQRRYGRVFVAMPTQMRGRSFDVVFVPSLAERMFPQKPREDPLLLDEARRVLPNDWQLETQTERAEQEKLQLRLAVGAARERLYVSFPTVEIGEGRPRVPSLYALEIWRAMTGRVPGADELQQAAARASGATLAWPAPASPNEAVDALEHDLATLRQLVGEPEGRARGRAQYMLQLNECLKRSVRERYMRGRRAWSHWDGLTRVTERTAPALDAHRLVNRAYSLSALQKYAVCPYQFLLSAIYRLRPVEDLAPLQRMDPLTRGSLFHAVQASFYRRIREAGLLPVTETTRDVALSMLDEAVREIAVEYRERLAPAVDRVWNDEIAAIRRNLRLWVDEIARAGDEWTPLWFEWAFGLGPGGSHSEADAERDAESRPDPVTIDGRYPLRGSIDLVEQRRTGELRVTDHKTGKYRGRDQMIVGGGAVLQPVVYGLVLEAATGRRVSEGRLYYATSEGGFRDVKIALTDTARRAGVEVLEIIDRAVETGFLAPAPDEKACTWCDFLPVCGPGAERRAGRFKAQDPLADLTALRRKP